VDGDAGRDLKPSPRRLTQLLREQVTMPDGARRRPTDVLCDPGGDPPLVIGYAVAGRLVACDGGENVSAGGIRLVRDVLDVQVLDREGRHRGRVGDVELEPDGAGRLRVVAVETGIRPVLDRCGLSRIWPGAPSDRIAWSQLHPSVGRAHALVSRAPRSARYHRVLRVRRRAPS
jgi:hypothetical protein